MLDVDKAPNFDTSISRLAFHPHEAFGTSKFDNSDEVRFPFSQPDVYVLPHRSYLYVEGTLSKTDRYTLATNGIAHGFEQIQLLLNGEVLDNTYMPGVAGLLKGYASCPRSSINAWHHAGWVLPSSEVSKNPCVDHESGTFSACVPLNTMLGVCEDFNRVLVNVRLELVVIRSSANSNMIVPRLPAPAATTPNLSTGHPELIITKMTWMIPYVTPSDTEKLHLLSLLGNDTPLSIGFRTWNLSIFPSLPTASKEFNWTIKTATQLEKPRYMIFGFQTGRRGVLDKDGSRFDHCKLSNIRLHVGSEMFPYTRLNLDFSKKRCATLYQMYVDFQRSYYQHQVHHAADPLLSYDEFLTLAPIAIIDCSHQVESATGNGALDIRLEFEVSEYVTAHSNAFCLLIHDKLVTYSPLSGLVRSGM